MMAPGSRHNEAGKGGNRTLFRTRIKKRNSGVRGDFCARTLLTMIGQAQISI